MGRIRSVKPELPQQPWFATLTDAAARTYYGLLSVVDDCGRCPADPLFIGGQIFWGRQRPAAAITRQLTELERAGIIRRYRARGGEYLEIVGWSSKGGPLYQQINKTPDERFPVPESLETSPETSPGSSPETSPEGKGREGKGREGKGEEIPPARDPALPRPAPDPQESQQPLATELPERAAPTARNRPGSETPEDRRPIQRAAPPADGPTARTLWGELEKARAEAGREMGVEVMPLAFGDVGERDLAGRLTSARSQGHEAVELVVRQTRHAIAMAKLETVRGEKPLEWFTGAVFSERNFRRLVGKTATRTARAGPQGSAERAPRKYLSTTTSDEPDLSYKP